MNVIDRQITVNGPRNVVIKLTGVLDTADVSEVPALALTDCPNSDYAQTLVGFRVDMVEWAISSGLEVNLYWDANTDQQLFPLSGRGRIHGANYGGFLPNQLNSGYTGNINLFTAGYAAGTKQNFTVVLECTKLYKHPVN